MRLHRLWLFVIIILPGLMKAATARNSGPEKTSPSTEAIEPAGMVVTTPVETWTYRSGVGVKESAAIMMPEELDDAGTLTLVLRTNAATTLIRLSRVQVPEGLRFLFGDANSLYVHAPRRAGWTPETVETMQVHVPYNKNKIPRRSRTLRLTDAAGRPVSDFRLGVNFPEQFFSYMSEPQIPFPIEYGTVELPVPVSPVPEPTHPAMAHHQLTMAPTAYRLFLTDKITNQTYEVSVPETDHTEPVTVMLPVMHGDTPEEVNVVEGSIVDHSGARTGAVSLSFGTLVYAMPGTRQDPTTITAKTLRPAPDGTFRIAVSDEFRNRYESGDDLYLQVREDIDGLFESSTHNLAWGSGARVVLPNRLNLVAQLVDKSREPIVLSDRLKEGVFPNFSLARIDEQGKQIQQDSMSANIKETTGALFNLKNLPVPGSYTLTAFDETFGPVEVSETSPTAPLEFRALTEDGRRVGNVQDEKRKPLAGALVLLMDERPRTGDYDDVTSLVEQLNGVSKERGLDILNAVTSKTLDYAITNEDGAYSFTRKRGREGNSYPYIYAKAPNRIAAYQQDTTGEHEVLPSIDVMLPDVQLPTKIQATGVVNAPALVPDNDHLGKLKPLADGDHKYWTSVWSSRQWFGYGRRGMVDDWEYVTESKKFPFGERFEYDVPVGTSYTLSARPADYQLHLNMHLWKQDPVQAGETAELEPVTLRALQPFHLKVTYADGSPAAGLRIDALYTQSLRTNGELREPITDADGEYLLYGDEGEAPSITVRRYMPLHTMEQFKIQKLDMSTSVPTLTLRLDPKIWGQDGRGRQ